MPSEMAGIAVASLLIGLIGLLWGLWRGEVRSRKQLELFLTFGAPVKLPAAIVPPDDDAEMRALRAARTGQPDGSDDALVERVVTGIQVEAQLSGRKLSPEEARKEARRLLEHTGVL